MIILIINYSSNSNRNSNFQTHISLRIGRAPVDSWIAAVSDQGAAEVYAQIVEVSIAFAAFCTPDPPILILPPTNMA